MANAVDEIEKIPAFMEKMKWPKAAALMKRWFASPSNDSPPNGIPDLTTIQMDSWVLNFQRAKDVYDAILRDKLWMNDASQKQVALMLRRKGLLRGKGLIAFGNLRAPQPIVHNDQINSRQVATGSLEPILDPLDDMYGALGRFNLDLSVEGTVSSTGAGFQISLSRVGVYVWDKYDFGGDQTLGYWNFSSGEVRKLPWFGYQEVTNQTFRDWRIKNKRGGDFYVFSDIKIIELKSPATFIIKS